MEHLILSLVHVVIMTFEKMIRRRQGREHEFPFHRPSMRPTNYYKSIDATNLPASVCDFYNVHSRNGIAHFRYKIEVLPWAVRWRFRISTFLNLYTLHIDYLGQPGWLAHPLLCIVYLRYILYIILRLYSSRPCIMHRALNYYQLSVIDQTLPRVHLK